MNNNIAATTARILYKIMNKYHLDTKKILQSMDIDADDLNNIHKRLPSDVYLNLWETAREQIDDPLFSMNVKDVWHPSDLHALGYAWMVSSTLRRSLERLQLFTNVATTIHRLELNNGREGFELRFEFSEKAFSTRYQIDHVMAMLMEMCRINTDHSLSPVSVHFTHNNSEYLKNYLSYYGAPVYFKAPYNMLVFSYEDVDKPLANSIPELAQVNDMSIINQLKKMSELDVVQKVKMIMNEQLSSGATIASVSRTLNLGERTLLRRLKDNGYTFKQLLDEVRQQLSKVYLLDKRWTITRASLELGFSDSSAFSRSFKHWTGVSPTEYQRRNGA